MFASSFFCNQPSLVPCVWKFAMLSVGPEGTHENTNDGAGRNGNILTPSQAPPPRKSQQSSCYVSRTWKATTGNYPDMISQEGRFHGFVELLRGRSDQACRRTQTKAQLRLQLTSMACFLLRFILSFAGGVPAQRAPDFFKAAPGDQPNHSWERGSL